MTQPDDESRRGLRRERDLGDALEASEQLTRGILAAVPAGVVHVTRDGAVKNANAEALRLLGLSYDALTDRYTSDFDAVTVREDGSPCPVEEYPVTRALVTGEPQPPCTIGVYRPDGGLSWCLFRAVPVKDVDGQLTGAVVTFLDITERKTIEDALRRSEAEIKAIVDSAPGIILTCDLDGRITFINRIVQGLDLETADVIGQSYYDWINERDRPMVSAQLARVVGGETVSFELEGLDGVDSNWYASRVGPIVRDGRVVGFATVATVINDLKKAEAERAQLLVQLNEAQRLEALGRLAGGIAHDFNNLLTVIQGNVDLLARHAEGPMATGIEEIAAAAERAASLTRQLLAFGRRQALEPRVLDLGETVEAIAGMLRRLIGEHIALEIESEPRLGFVRADPVAVERVIVNLAVNGSEAMPNGGTLTIATRNATAMGDGTVHAGQYVCLEVTDDGHGIDEATQRRVFEPFFTTKGSGTGLGLATVHGIVSQSGGHITLDSRPGLGTTFRVFLPRTAAPERSMAQSAVGAVEGLGTARASARGERILLVEDDASVRRVARMILESAGYAVVVAEAPEGALEIVDDELRRIDLLVSDVVMPGHSGLAIAKALEARSPGLRVLLISGHVQQTIGERPQRFAFLHKPFTAQAFLEAVARTLAGDQTSS